MAAKTKVAEDYTGRQFVVTREFDAPRELVFRAWTDPKHLAQWWGPKGFTNNATDEEIKTFDSMHGSMTQGWTGTLDQLADYLSKV